ncbi:hypothetical protein PV11_10113 [Exophiala sideris]|uniref:Xylanolytic transcriptional activator regulatory domain-containing protein n=1 Tax=Exophiala sideris TaxID=1016849 RepID=A0A0D1WTD0_9EURO|nr:hypothetical protein PV11_10113 [Exophiala sideris]
MTDIDPSCASHATPEGQAVDPEDHGASNWRDDRLADDETRPLTPSVGQGSAPRPPDDNPPPIYLQESQSKILAPMDGQYDAPSCGRTICNALTVEKRIELLFALKSISDIDINDGIFSLNGMKQGIHLYARNISIEYSIVHNEFLLPSKKETKTAMEEAVGGPATPELLWAVITLGWALMRSDNSRELGIACEIQRALRKAVISHPALTLSPPLSLVQTFFFALVFARYQGTREEYGFSVIFHSVLLDAVRRLDLRSSQNHDISASNTMASLYKSWAIWMHKESIKRILLQTFVLDVKHSLLHCGNLTISPADVHLSLPLLEDAWYLNSAEEWTAAMSLVKENSRRFISILEEEWASPRSDKSGNDLQSSSNAILYGMVAVARGTVKQRENAFTNKSAQSLEMVADTMQRYLKAWDRTKTHIRVSTTIQSFLWRNCSCMARLSHTLYEITPMDLQIVAGKNPVEGKFHSAADYMRSKCKIRAWAMQRRSLSGVSCAAKVLRERFCSASDSVHSHHCLWCLYLASMRWFSGEVEGEGITSGRPPKD